MFKSKKLVYFIILAIFLICLVYFNWSYISPLIEGAYPYIDETDPDTTPPPDEGAAYEGNKVLTGNINSNSENQPLAALEADIKECQAMIDQINEMLPRDITDVRVGEVQQTTNLDDVKIGITASSHLTMDPILNKEVTTAIWTINATLPKGLKGPKGNKGSKGKKGEQGAQGPKGQDGIQGKWAKQCPGQSCP